MRGDRVFGLVVTLAALGYIVSAAQIRVGFLSDPVGSRTFPYMIGGVGLLCGLAMLLRPDPDPEWPGPPAVVRIAVTLVVLVAFAVTLRPVGFLLPAALASAILAWLIRPDLARAALAGVGLSLGLFAVLKYGLGLGLAPFGRVLTG
ncbi:MAG: tripartite tricarboxylate transporter TctB family protein [Alphaproteobacteria bacterium]|nr:tripartite tricarboxylate transporter TctB family protein [Alphaproteobacteria bacterium]